MKVYVAAPLTHRATALLVARAARFLGFEVVSTWHDLDEARVEIENTLSPQQQGDIADTCFAEIDKADSLFLVLPKSQGRVGSFVEAGYAIRAGLQIKILTAGGTVPCLLQSRCLVQSLEEFVAQANVPPDGTFA